VFYYDDGDEPITILQKINSSDSSVAFGFSTEAWDELFNGHMWSLRPNLHQTKTY